MDSHRPPEATDDADAQAALLPDGVRELGLAEALQLAIRLHQQDRLEGARTLYQRILQVQPGHADALCLLGTVEHRLGRSDDGLRLIRDAIAQRPDFAGDHVNLGNVLTEIDRLDEALAAYRRAAELAPESADVHNNLGALYRVLGQPEQARRHFDRAIAIDGRHMRAWNNLALLLDAQGDTQAAVSAFLTALELSPDHDQSIFLLGTVYHRSGQVAKAAEVFRQWLARDPHNPVPAHLYAACSGQSAPVRASDAYVEAEFDGFAASFERVLNGRLHYRAPQLVAGLLQTLLSPPAAALDLVDLGCGTGLCGPLVAPWARRLVGVDLSGGMLARARSKGVYAYLVKEELTAFLGKTPGYWDAAVCADTLCYFGDLRPVMQAAATALRPAAPLVFTVEALPDDGADHPVLQPSGRYAHGRAHIDRVVAESGLVLRAARREVLRQEGGADVNGWLVAVQRPQD
jgi:predicted TPR repeat methyltransferase